MQWYLNKVIVGASLFVIIRNNDGFLTYLSQDFTKDLQFLTIDRNIESYDQYDAFCYKIVPGFREIGVGVAKAT